jgi:hypothetical protein
MSSVMRGPAQIPDRSKYLIGIMDTSGGAVPPISRPLNGTYTYAFQVPPGTFGSSDQVANLPLSSFSTDVRTGYIQIRQNMLFKDLGRQLYVYDQVGAGANLLCIYRNCARMNSIFGEGIDPNPIFNNSQISYNNFWVKIWSSFSGNSFPTSPNFALSPAVARLG